MNIQKSKVAFESFNAGICNVYNIDEDGNAGTLLESLRYQKRVIGTKRYYEAMTAKVQVDRLIRIPFQPWITTEYLAVIEGEVYEIVQVQEITDTRPKVNDLSLHITRQRRVSDGTI
jgi:hypothetical protein